jgi:hypothetical protein
MTHDLTLLHYLLNNHRSRQPQGPKNGVQQPRQHNLNQTTVVYEIFSRNIQYSCPIVFFCYQP